MLKSKIHRAAVLVHVDDANQPIAIDDRPEVLVA
jgi:hypothetical protein